MWGLLLRKRKYCTRYQKGKVRLTNLIGRIFIKEFDKGNPYVIDSIIENSEENPYYRYACRSYLREKESLHYVDGRVSAVLGTTRTSKL